MYHATPARLLGSLSVMDDESSDKWRSSLQFSIHLSDFGPLWNCFLWSLGDWMGHITTSVCSLCWRQKWYFSLQGWYLICWLVCSGPMVTDHAWEDGTLAHWFLQWPLLTKLPALLKPGLQSGGTNEIEIWAVLNHKLKYIVSEFSLFELTHGALICN